MKLKTEDGEPIDQVEQLERWVEHNSKLYAQGLLEHPDMEAVLPSFGAYTELAEEPTKEELSEAISGLSNVKAPGEDGIKGEIVRKIKMFFSRAFMHSFMWDAKIVTLYKNKGDMGDCGDYRGISLLSVAGKIF